MNSVGQQEIRRSIEKGSLEEDLDTSPNCVGLKGAEKAVGGRKGGGVIKKKWQGQGVLSASHRRGCANCGVSLSQKKKLKAPLVKGSR